MTQTNDIETLLESIFNGYGDVEDVMEEIDSVEAVSTYSDVGMMTHNKGVVFTMADGSEFQLTIVKSG